MKKILLTSILFISAYATAQSFKPGLWKSKESLTLNGIPLPSSNGEECLTQAQTKDAKATIENELKKKGCSLTKWNVKNKKIEASIQCDNEDMIATGNLSGEFTTQKYNLKGEVKGKYRKALPAVAQLKLSGEWVKSCVK